MKISIAGTFEGLTDGVKFGDIVDVPDERGARYCRLHYADPVVDLKEERAVAPEAAEVRAVEVDAVKRGPGRPPKTVEA
jgi:hypothetical protein